MSFLDQLRPINSRFSHYFHRFSTLIFVSSAYLSIAQPLIAMESDEDEIEEIDYPDGDAPEQKDACEELDYADPNEWKKRKRSHTATLTRLTRRRVSEQDITLSQQIVDYIYLKNFLFVDGKVVRLKHNSTGALKKNFPAAEEKMITAAILKAKRNYKDNANKINEGRKNTQNEILNAFTRPRRPERQEAELTVLHKEQEILAYEQTSSAQVAQDLLHQKQIETQRLEAEQARLVREISEERKEYQQVDLELQRLEERRREIDIVLRIKLDHLRRIRATLATH